MLNITLPRFAQAIPTEWTPVWPTTEGVYWFYGFPWGLAQTNAKADKPDLLCVLVRKVSNGVLYVTEGYTINQGEAVGFWTPVVLPGKPSHDNTRQVPPAHTSLMWEKKEQT